MTRKRCLLIAACQHSKSKSRNFCWQIKVAMVIHISVSITM